MLGRVGVFYHNKNLGGSKLLVVKDNYIGAFTFICILIHFERVMGANILIPYRSVFR